TTGPASSPPSQPVPSRPVRTTSRSGLRRVKKSIAGTSDRQERRRHQPRPRARVPRCPAEPAQGSPPGRLVHRRTQGKPLLSLPECLPHASHHVVAEVFPPRRRGIHLHEFCVRRRIYSLRPRSTGGHARLAAFGTVS